jgi:methylglutamate dehydrogenase subunit D
MSDLAATPALTKLTCVGSGAGVRARLKDGLAIVSVLARVGAAEAVADRAQAAFGLALTTGPGRGAAGNISALGIGPGRWLFLREESGNDFPAMVAAALEGVASISDHSDGYAVFEIEGPRARHALAKGVPVDLDAAMFGESDAAVTLIAHIGAIVWREAPERFCIAVFRSFADSFWHWLSASSAEYGLVAE